MVLTTKGLVTRLLLQGTSAALTLCDGKRGLLGPWALRDPPVSHLCEDCFGCWLC